MKLLNIDGEEKEELDDIENWEDTTPGCGVLRALIPSKLIKSLFKDKDFQ